MNQNEILRKIPRVDHLLSLKETEKLCSEYGRERVTEIIRKELEDFRDKILMAKEESVQWETSAITSYVTDRIKKRVQETSEPSFQRVFNATGIILHTNLGRAPLGKKQMLAVMESMTGYSNLEYDLSKGKRGKRQAHYAEVVCQVTGAEAAVAVNNNASAVALILAAMAEKKEVIVSRGELIEIGGHFRIPEVMEQSGAVLRETGCTNRTRISDYEQAVNEETAAFLKVHTSNYKIVGFTEDVSIKELADLGEKKKLPVIVDLGSGVLVDLEKYGLAHEPTVQEVLKQGADVVCFSGDKLLGGPQAGIIAGKKKYIQAMENHPLMRALRLDKFTTAALEATFREYLNEESCWENIPVLRMIARTEEELLTQAEEIAWELDSCGYAGEITVEKSLSAVGGGSLPGEVMPDYAVGIFPKKETAQELAVRLRKLPIPVIAHISNDKVMLEMRTISSEEKQEFAGELREAFSIDFSFGGCL